MGATLITGSDLLTNEDGFVVDGEGDILRSYIEQVEGDLSETINEVQDAEAEAASALNAMLKGRGVNMENIFIGVLDGRDYFVARVGREV